MPFSTSSGVRARVQNTRMTAVSSFTDLIQRVNGGDSGALKLVFDATYDDLHRLARTRLIRSSCGPLLDTTSLVHESYLRFADAERLAITDRQHFFRYAGHVMRSVIVDFVRERLAARRGGDALHVTLNTQMGEESPGEDQILRINDALEELARFDERLVSVVEMRYFAGMSMKEIADALGLVERTVRRDWEKAKLILAEALS